MEGSHSGRVRTLGKRICPKGYRGFESPSLRSNRGVEATFIDKTPSMCFNLDVDNSFGAYKDKIGTRIAGILGESLSQGTITEDQSDEIANYILENIDLATTNSELFTFIENLSAKWPIFSSILTSSDQAQTPLSTANSVQEKTDQIIHTTEDLIKENKIDEALQVAKTATENPGQNPSTDVGGGI